MKKLLTLLLLAYVAWGCREREREKKLEPEYVISQKVWNCNDKGLQIETTVMFGSNLIYIGRTWRNGDADCFSPDSLPSIWREEKIKAEQFIERFKPVNPFHPSN